MKKKLILLTIILVQAVAVFGQAKAKETAGYDTGAGFVNKRLANGLDIIVLPDRSVPLVTVELAVRNGSFTEPLEFNGLSHLYEHMFFKPSKAQRLYLCEQAQAGGYFQYFRSNNCSEKLGLKPRIGDVSYFGRISRMGISYNGTTREEIVNFYYTTTSRNLETTIKFMSDSAQFPHFDEEDLEREKKVVIGEIDRNESSPGYFLNNALQSRLFYKYPTRKNPLGTRATVLSATVEKMKTIQSRYYVPNNSAVIVTGDVDPANVFALVDKYFGGWEKREKDPFVEFPMVKHPALEKSDATIVLQPVNAVFIQLGWHGPSIGVDNDSTYAADVFSYILGQPDSKFQKELVDSGLALSAGLGYYTQRNTGPIYMSIVTTPEKAKAAIAKAYEQIDQFDSKDYFTDQELENSKTILESRDLFEREELSEYAHTLGFWWSSTGIDYFRGYHKNLRAVSRKQINYYVNRYIKDKPRVGAVMLSEQAQRTAKITEEDLKGEK